MGIPNSTRALFLAAAGQATGYEISRSLRFNSSDSAYLSRTPASAGNRKTWTWAGWVKLAALNTGQNVIFSATDGTTPFAISVSSSGPILFGNLTFAWKETTAVLRDYSAWYHFCVAVDTTQASNANRLRFYVNGVEQTAFSTNRDLYLDTDLAINGQFAHEIGRYSAGSNQYFPGYLADVHFIDGQALTPSSFTKTDATTGQLVPIEYTGGYSYTASYASFFSYSNVDSGSVADVFDGSTATEFEFNSGGGNGVFAPQGGITYTTSVEVYSARTTTMNVSLNGGANVAYGNGWTTIASGSGTLNTLTFSNGSAGNQKLGAIRVDGVILTTGTFDGANSFHLPFSDNSTAAALGTDTSGNSNTWTVNSISVGFSVTQNYSTTTTGTAPTPYLSSIYFSAFDGDTSTSFAWTPGTWAMDWTSLPSAVTVSSSLRIFCYPRLGTLTVNINGSNVASITGNSPDWRTISFTGTINTISFNGTDTYSSVYAIEVDGAILIDPRANSVNDSLVDTPSSTGVDAGNGGEVRGNYATLNPLVNAGLTLSNGNLDFTSDLSNRDTCIATHGVSSGKWYWEYTVSGASYSTAIGIEPAGYYPVSDARTGWDSAGYAWWLDRQEKYHNGSVSATSYGAAVSSNAVIGVALDLDVGSLTFYLNGVSQGSAYTGISGTYLPSICDCANASTGGSDGIGAGSMNFGQRPFAYTAPSGYKALCTTNLPDPVVAQPSTVMDVKLYDGNSSTQSITGLGFSPDFVWIKGRTTAENHVLSDIIRGTNTFLYSDSTGAESTSYSNVFNSFDSTGFTLGYNASFGGVNVSGRTYVAWTWDAGSTFIPKVYGDAATVSNTAALSTNFIGTASPSPVPQSLQNYDIDFGSNVTSVDIKYTYTSGSNIQYLTSTDGSTWTSHSTNNTQTAGATETITSGTAFRYLRFHSPSGNFNQGFQWINNTDGSITSTVRANASAGFSIVTYTGNGSSPTTVGHGLNVAPSFLIAKNRDSTANWQCYHIGAQSSGALQLQLNTTAAATSNVNVWNNTAPTSSVFSIGAGLNSNTEGHVVYCFAPVAGYSSFGSYVANGSADGPFVYTGFRPRWIMIKAASDDGDMSYASWLILDTSRSSYNICTESLYANANYQEGLRGNGTSSGAYLDILSNGFKIKYNGSEVNGVNGQTYVYACFAESPFKTSRAR